MALRLVAWCSCVRFPRLCLANRRWSKQLTKEIRHRTKRAESFPQILVYALATLTFLICQRQPLCLEASIMSHECQIQELTVTSDPISSIRPNTCNPEEYPTEGTKSLHHTTSHTHHSNLPPPHPASTSPSPPPPHPPTTPSSCPCSSPTQSSPTRSPPAPPRPSKSHSPAGGYCGRPCG
jgi:hypothetical protein